eukprot:509787_1
MSAENSSDEESVYIPFANFTCYNHQLSIPHKQYLLKMEEGILVPSIKSCTPQPIFKSTNTKYTECYHNVELLLTPMYILQSWMPSTQKRKSKNKIGWVSFSSAHKNVHNYINKAMKNKSICKSCALELFLHTKGLIDLIESTVYIMDINGCIKRGNPSKQSLCFQYVIYSSLIISFIAHHANIMRYIFKEYDKKLQKQIVFVIIEFHKHVKDWAYHYKVIQKQGWFFYSITDIMIV